MSSLNLLQLKTSKIRDSEYSQWLAQSLFKDIFDTSLNGPVETHFGLYSTNLFTISESRFYAKSQFSSPEMIKKFFYFEQLISEIRINTQDAYTQTLDYTQKVVEKKLLEFVIFSVTFAFWMLLVYFFYFLPYFSKEQKKIVALEKILRIIVSDGSLRNDPIVTELNKIT